MAVPSTDKHQLPQCPPLEQFPRLAQGGVVPVVEPYPNQLAIIAGSFHDRVQIPDIPAGRLLHQNVLPGRKRCNGHFRQGVVRRGYDHNVHVVAPNRGAPIRLRDGTGNRPDERPRPVHREVGADDKLRSGKDGGALATDQPAADDGYPHRTVSHHHPPNAFRGPSG